MNFLLKVFVCFLVINMILGFFIDQYLDTGNEILNQCNDEIAESIEQLPSEGQCKLAAHMIKNSRYYTVTYLRKASEINKQCKAIDDKKPQ